MNRVNELVVAAREGAEKLAQAQCFRASADLAYAAGQVEARNGLTWSRAEQLADYHLRQARRCGDGLARKFHLDAVQFLRGEL